MTKTKKAKNGGSTHLVAAVICERLIREQDDTFSVIRILDTVSVDEESIRSPDADGKSIEPFVGLSFLVVLSSDVPTSVGRKVRVDATSPSGKVRRGLTATVYLIGPGGSSTVYGELPVNVSEDGLHWYDVVVDGKSATRLPMMVRHLKPVRTPD